MNPQQPERAERSDMDTTTTRMGRKTCVHCSERLDNGEPLTTRTTEVSTRWGTNSAGMMTERPIEPYQALVPAHAKCEQDSSLSIQRSRVEAAEEQLEEIVEWVAGGMIPEDRIARWEAIVSKEKARYAEMLRLD